MLITPLLISLLFLGKRKNRGRIHNVFILLVYIISTGVYIISLSEIYTSVAYASNSNDNYHYYYDDGDEDSDNEETLDPLHNFFLPGNTLPGLGIPSIAIQNLEEYLYNTYNPNYAYPMFQPTDTLESMLCAYAPHPGVQNYVPTIEPSPYIKWYPSVYLDNDLNELIDDQFHPDINLDEIKNDPTFDNGWGGNLCGHSSVAIIVQSLLGFATPLTEMFKAMSYLYAPEGETKFLGQYFLTDLTRGLAIANYLNNWGLNYTIYSSNQVFTYAVNPANANYDSYFYDVWAIDWDKHHRSDAIYGSVEPEALLTYLRLIVKPQLVQNHYHIAYVTALKSNGYLVERGTSDTTGHYIVITGFSQEWDKGPGYQWVRIYNPFSDGPEYYTVNDFIKSLDPYQSLEIWQ